MPNLVFRDGFDTYNGGGTAVGLRTKWNVPGNDFLFTTGRFGVGQCMRPNPGFGPTCYTKPFTGLSQLTVECGWKSEGGSIGQHIKLREGTTVHVGLGFVTGGGIQLYRNDSVIASSGLGLFIDSTWYSFQWEVVMSDTVGRSTLYLDGVKVWEVTGIDTITSGTGAIDNLFITAAQAMIDDLIITDSATRLSNPIRASTLYPNADGATLNLTPSTGTSHFAVVDEATASQSDYLSGSNVGDLDLLGLTNLPSTPLSIQEINVIGYASKTDAVNRSYALGVKSGATVSDGENFSLASSGGRSERPLALDPNTGAAWTAAAVNALELQPKITV